MLIRCHSYAVRIFVVIVLTIVPTFAQHNKKEGDKCTLQNGSIGNCRLVENCSEAIRSLKTNGVPGLPRCGFKNLNEIVCCPLRKTEHPENSAAACQAYSKKLLLRIDPFIHGGVDAEEGEFPHMAAVGFDDNGIISYECGGTLISDRYVITAAHCTISNRGLAPSIVKLGTNNIRGNTIDDLGVDYLVDQIVTHPDYNPPMRYNDIALLHLNRDVVFSNKIIPACLHTTAVNNTIKPIATGWGILNRTDDKQHSILQKVSLPLIDTVSCNEAYIPQGEQRRLPRGIDGRVMICAGTNNGTTDTCTGDSGGPLQVEIENTSNWSIIGLTSFGVACGGSPVPGVYTKISNYIDWIERIVWRAT